MAQSGYFDTPEVSGFVWRTFYEEANGRVTITDLQLQSKEYTGPTWYPKGQVAVNGAALLKMDYSGNATHAFSIYSAGDSFASIQTLTGQALPVSSGVIATGKAEISVSVELYRDGDTAKPALSGSVALDIASVILKVHDGEEFVQKQPVIKHDTGVKNYRPILHDGFAWGI